MVLAPLNLKGERGEKYSAIFVRPVSSRNPPMGSGSSAEYRLDGDFWKWPNDPGLWKEMNASDE